MKKNKYKYLLIIQGNYGYGWEDLGEYDNYRKALKNLKEYNELSPQYQHKITQRRVLNEN